MPTPSTTIALPSLAGQIPPDAETAIQLLRQAVETLGTQVYTPAAPVTLTPALLAQIKAALAPTGASPLNIFQLLGGNSLTTVKSGTHAQRIALNPTAQTPGSLFYETDRAALYITIFPSWVLVEQNRPLAVTLAPSTLPSDLTLTDAGFVVSATDFNRVYQWTGSAWTDAPGADARFGITFFSAAPSPAAGWQICDGATVNRSTAAAGVTGITVPNLTGANRFLRGGASAGATGGSATTHTHTIAPATVTTSSPSPSSSDYPNTPDTGTEDTTVEVQSGTGVEVAAENHRHFMENHTHGIDHLHDVAQSPFASGTPSGAGGDDALPPYYTAIPYIRL